MNTTALTIKYRPQTFAQVVGQDTLRAILSRASLENRIAPAYLFSGTRGVGKTTLARIFAKALNCRNAPAAEPCNQCDQCRAVTMGASVDVVEIDGASNRGIDDVRRLKEVVGYAPMEGKYKIFIIDEAHMLSREAFNALLKTLEEPPAAVTFIMATTEPHKFPATIVSRCQHYVFKRLPENALTEHLVGILEREAVEYEISAVRLIARRGAGSVRDAMSLLGQVLALGAGKLTEESARSVLGLAGQEAFMSMLEAFKSGDTLSLCKILHEMLDQGLDMGFFLRELAALWRNMFILRQSGETALSVVELPENEAQFCLKASRGFSLQHIHACWQMTLEGQRRVLASLEPALGLELLLVNLAVLPQLLSLEHLSALSRRGDLSGNEGNERGACGRDIPGAARNSSTVTQEGALPQGILKKQECAEEAATQGQPDHVQPGELCAAPAHGTDTRTDRKDSASSVFPDDAQEEDRHQEAKAFFPIAAEEKLSDAPSSAPPDKDLDWQTIFTLAESQSLPPWLLPVLRNVRASWRDSTLVLVTQDDFTAERLNEPLAREALEPLLRAWCNVLPPLEIQASPAVRKNREELHGEILGHPLVREIQRQFGAKIIDYGQIL